MGNRVHWRPPRSLCKINLLHAGFPDFEAILNLTPDVSDMKVVKDIEVMIEFDGTDGVTLTFVIVSTGMGVLDVLRAMLTSNNCDWFSSFHGALEGDSN